MRQLFVLATLLFVLPVFMSPSLGDERTKGKSDNPALKGLETRLKKMLEEASPKAEIALEENELVVKYQTQPFMIHARSRNGEYAKKAHEEVGPNDAGFVLTVTIKDGKYTGPLRLPQAIREPYWTTFVNEFPISIKKENTEYLWLSLSYGERVEAALLTKFKECVAGR